MVHWVGLGLQILGSVLAGVALVLQLRSVQHPTPRLRLFTPEALKQSQNPYNRPPSIFKGYDGVTEEMLDAYQEHDFLLRQVAEDVTGVLDTYLDDAEYERRLTLKLVALQMGGLFVALVGTALT